MVDAYEVVDLWFPAVLQPKLVGILLTTVARP